MHILAGYEVSMIKVVTVQLYTDDADTDDANDNTTRQTKHDCIGSLPNEPKTSIKVEPLGFKAGSIENSGLVNFPNSGNFLFVFGDNVCH